MVVLLKKFLGKGITLNTNLEISDDSVKGKLVYSKPNFAYTDNTLLTSFEATSTDLLTDFGYKVTKNGFSIGTDFEQYENLLILQYRFLKKILKPHQLLQNN